MVQESEGGVVGTGMGSGFLPREKVGLRSILLPATASKLSRLCPLSTLSSHPYLCHLL